MIYCNFVFFSVFIIFFFLNLIKEKNTSSSKIDGGSMRYNDTIKPYTIHSLIWWCMSRSYSEYLLYYSLKKRLLLNIYCFDKKYYAFLFFSP